jgi:N-hydroxyarylamine O-acetyltransferase
VAFGLTGTRHRAALPIGHGIENRFPAHAGRPWTTSVEETAEICREERSAAPLEGSRRLCADRLTAAGRSGIITTPFAMATGVFMSNDGFDREAWLARIGYVGELAPTLDTLRGLVWAHAQAIPYESLDIMLGQVPDLRVPELQRKMILNRRGGYCFEQNTLFRAGLRSLGFNVTSLQGRVVRGLAIDAPRPAIHMLLQVELAQGPYLADVGFGNLAPTAPLSLERGVEQPTPHETMRFVEVAGELTLQARLGDRWEHIYRVIPYPRYDAEYEVANWYTATHPDAPYPRNMIAARPVSGGNRITLFNRRLKVRHPDGSSEARAIDTTDAFGTVLRDTFGIAVTQEDVRRMVDVMEERGTRGAPHPFFA